MGARTQHEFAGTARFKIVRSLGRGGMGVVYEAYDRDRDAKVALKTVVDLDAHRLYRFKNEFRALQGLTHPNLVTLGELIEHDGTWFFTMELVPGTDFLSYVWRTTRARVVPPDDLTGEATLSDLPSERSVRSTREEVSADVDEPRLRSALGQLARALVAIHDAGKVHRDVKPSNIRITPEGRVVLLDFGLIADTSANTASYSVDGRIEGTPAYMAPEAGSPSRVGAPADWYSFGILLYQALTGTLPFTGDSVMDVLMKKHQYPAPPPRALVPNVAADLDALCVALLQAEPARRPSGRAILERLGALPATISSVTTSTQTAGWGPFVGRVAELAMLRSAYDDAGGDSAVVVSVHGESGLGKSALIHQFVSTIAAEVESAVILTGRCYESESVPYKALDGVIDSLSHYLRRLPERDAAELVPRNASMLRRVFPVLDRVEVIAQAPIARREVSDPHELRHRAFVALRELFDLMLERRRLIVVIDDLQWADADSLQLLRELLAPPDPPPILLLVSSREDPDAPKTAVAKLGDVRRVVLEPMNRVEALGLARLLIEQLGVADRSDPVVITDEARGHPMYISELVRHAQVAREQAPVLRLDDVIRSRIAIHSESARQLLELVATAGAPLRLETLCNAAKMKRANVDRDVSMLRVSYLVRVRAGDSTRIEPYHDRVREAVIGGLAPAAVIAWHRRIAVALESADTEEDRSELLVRHFEAAGEPLKAARWAEVAAQHAAETLAYDRAAELFRTALRLGEHDDAKLRSMRARLADSLANAGRGADAADEYLRAAEGADLATRRELQRNAAEQLLVTGHVERGLEAIEKLLSEAGATLPKTPRRAIAALLWHRARLALRGFSWKERHEREIADSDLARIDVFEKAGEGLGFIDTVRGAVFQTRGLLLALDAGERKRIARAFAIEATYRAAGGARGRARARKFVDAARELADACGDASLQASALAGEAAWRYLAGEFRGALELLREAEARLANSGSTLELNNARLFLVIAMYFTGDLRAVAKLVEDLLRDADRRGDLYALTTFRRLGSLRWLARDEPHKAHADLDQTSWTPPEGGFHLQHWYELMSRGELALYEGAVAEANDRLQVGLAAMDASLLMGRIQMTRASVAYLRGKLSLALAESGVDRKRNLKIAARCTRKLLREDIGYATCWGRLIGAGVAAQRRDTEAAVMWLDDAITVGEKHELGLFTMGARLRKGQLVGGDVGAELIAAASTWYHDESILKPQRFVAVVAPGFRIDVTE